MFFAKLAQQNIRKNKQAFGPFILSMIFLTALNTLMLLVSNDPGLAKMPSATAVTQLFGFGSIVTLILSLIFATYTGSILNKQRKKEFGLYNILGLGKRELYKLNFFESLFSLVITLIVGLLSGVVFSRLSYLIIKKGLGVGNEFSFGLQPEILIIVTLVMIGLYLWLYLLSTISIFKSDPIVLLHAKQKGEKEPKANWLIALIGVISLTWGYWLALTIKSPLAALNRFFLAVVLVILGTYFLFMAGSIVILKLLRKNENYYYNVKHFIPISGMIYRMKQNAVGLASICILSTMVLVTVATTTGLFFGADDQVKQAFPRDIMISSNTSLSNVKSEVKNYATKAGVELTDFQEVKSTQSLISIRQGSYLKVLNTMVNAYTANGADKVVSVVLMNLNDYHRSTGSKQTLKRQSDVLLYTTDSQYHGDTLNLSGNKFNVSKKLKTVDNSLDYATISPVPVYVVVLKDQGQIDSLLNKWYTTEKMMDRKESLYQLNFNFSLKDAAKRKAFIRGLSKAVTKEGTNFSFESKDSYRESIKVFDGGFFFIGIILGIAFLLANVLIIYYKQVSEGMDDRERFVILQKVGMDDQEVKRVIHSQIMLVFAFPLIMALIHIAFAFPLIKKLLVLFGITNWQLFLLITIIVSVIFSIIYYLVYRLTARVYYRLVER